MQSVVERTPSHTRGQAGHLRRGTLKSIQKWERGGGGGGGEREREGGRRNFYLQGVKAAS